MNLLSKKVLLIGWDGADWNIINPLIESGRMPALERLINNGVMGNIATLDPPISPMLWTSIATGKKADKHGILGFLEPAPKNAQIRDVRTTSRKTNAIWNILNQQNKKSNVISWWPSHPAEQINGNMVSNLFYLPHSSDINNWKIPQNSVFPENLINEISDLRVHPAEITQAHILPFVNNAINVNQDNDFRLIQIAKNISATASVQSITTYLMENKEWDLTAVYFNAIDHFSHIFMKYHPPQIPGIDDESFNLYNDVVNSAYIFHDLLLERLVQLVDKDTTIILLSDHGFLTDNLRPKTLPSIPAAPALEHSNYGILCISGPDIKKDERIYGASLLDITPTILSLFGLPIGKDMDGKVLVNAFRNEFTPDFIDSYDKADIESDKNTETIYEDTYESFEAFKQLIELGYIENPGDDKMESVQKVKNEAQYNLARIYYSSGEYHKASEILQELYLLDNKDIRFNLDLAYSYLNLNKLDDANKIINNLKLIEDKHKPNIDLLEGVYFIHKGMPRKALEYLKKVEQHNAEYPYLLLQLASAYLQLGKFKNSADCYKRIIHLDNNNAKAFHGLGLCYLRQKKLELAIDNFLNSIGLIYYNANVHYHLGESLFLSGKYLEALNAFKVCIKMSPEFIKARIWINKIYSGFVEDKQEYINNNKIVNEYMKGEIIIVSGLPRSGTSLMMQMLEHANINLLYDEIRKSDINNPNGYYEYAAVKNIAKDNSFIDLANGKAIKVIAQLLEYLPSNYFYKIIFVNRNMNEIIVSQQKMLNKRTDILPLNLINAFNKTLQQVDLWVNKEPNCSILYVNFSDIINQPEVETLRVSSFLKKDLNLKKMIKAIKPELYRNKENIAK